MAQQTFAGLAALVALTFALLAATACANSEHRDTHALVGPSASTPEGASYDAIPEFHGAAVGSDLLRSRLQTEG